MKSIIKTIASMAAAAAMAVGVTPAAYAERTEDYTREEIIDQYWTQYWEDSLPCEENPEGSLEYHILESFLDEQYGHYSYEDDKYVVSDWSSKYGIRKAWQEYKEEYTKNWHYVDDDETGEFYIESYDPETDTYGDDKLYTFTLADGEWHMVDSNGNIVDSFAPHGGDGSWAKLNEDDGEEDMTYDVGGYVNGKYQGNGADDDDPEADYDAPASGVPATEDENAGGNARVTGGVAAKPAEAPTSKAETSVNEEAAVDKDSEDEDGKSPLLYAAAGIIIVVAGAGVCYALTQKGKR